jgi:hypothetical protein
MITANELTGATVPTAVAAPKGAKKVSPSAPKPEVQAEAPAKKAVGKRGRKPAEGPTKQSKANEIFKRENGDKEKVIAAIQAECQMSFLGAQTYFYNAKRAVAREKAIEALETPDKK